MNKSSLVVFVAVICAACGASGSADDTSDQDSGSIDTGSDATTSSETSATTDSDSASPVDTIPLDLPTDTAPLTCTPGAASPCVEVDPGYPNGTATCGAEGTWDFSNCYYGEMSAPVYGVIHSGGLNRISYTLDGSKIEDQVYIALNSMHVLPRAVITGDYHGSAFPAAGLFSMSYAWRVEQDGQPMMLVMQMSEEGINPVNPVVQLLFLTDDLRPGRYLMGQNVVASLIDGDNKTNTQCVAAMAFGGSVVVTAAEGTTKVQGGKFSFYIPSTANLYHPSATPYGDFSATLDPASPACPKQ